MPTAHLSHLTKSTSDLCSRVEVYCSVVSSHSIATSGWWTTIQRDQWSCVEFCCHQIRSLRLSLVSPNFVTKTRFGVTKPSHQDLFWCHQTKSLRLVLVSTNQVTETRFGATKPSRQGSFKFHQTMSPRPDLVSPKHVTETRIGVTKPIHQSMPPN